METLSQEAQYKLMRGWLNERQWPGGLAQEGLARSPARPESPEKRSAKAANRHDLEALVACFAPDYRSEQPLYPERNFTGQAGVRKNWSFFFSTMPDFQVDILSEAVEGDTVWAELRFHGTQVDGKRQVTRGVTISGIQGEQIVWAKLYIVTIQEPHY